MFIIHFYNNFNKPVKNEYLGSFSKYSKVTNCLVKKGFKKNKQTKEKKALCGKKPTD